MIRKFLQGVLIAMLVAVMPLICKPAMLKAPHLWIFMVIIVAASVFQPSYNPFRSAPDEKDKGTARQIIWSIYLTQLCMLIEAQFFRYPDSITWSMVTTVGLVFMLFGLAVRTWAVLLLGTFFTWHISSRADQKVITTGPYALVRHPGYLGAFCTYIGSTVFFHSWFVCVLSVVVLSFAFYRRIRFEEKELKTSIGAEYENYSKSVKLIIPYIF